MKKKLFYSIILIAVLLFVSCSKPASNDNPVANQQIVTDVNGNNYNTINIGTQAWFQSNLNVDKYRNGDPIPQVQDITQWANLTSGAWCYYLNLTSNGLIYGKLYNWYAVNDPRGLAPQGWHVPSVNDCNILINQLGGQQVAGGKLKSTGFQFWLSPNNGATNESGFSALPGGRRLTLSSQNFDSINGGGYWWTASELTNTSYAQSIRIITMDSYCTIGGYEKNIGLSVRCLKD